MRAGRVFIGISGYDYPGWRGRFYPRALPRREWLGYASARFNSVELAPKYEAARLKLAELPRNANPTRVRNRCELTGRSRAYYRKFRLSRIMLRELANKGLIPGVVKSSW